MMNTDKKVKRLKISDWIVIAYGKNKLIFKDPRSKRHLTLKIDEKGIDIHETEEGEVKKHRPIMQKGTKEFEEELQKQLTAIIKEARVNINDPRLTGYVLAIPPADENERYQKMLVHKGRDAILPKDVLEREGEQIINDYISVRLQDAMNVDFTKSYVFDESGRFVGGLVKVGRDCYLITNKMLERLSRCIFGPYPPA